VRAARHMRPWRHPSSGSTITSGADNKRSFAPARMLTPRVVPTRSVYARTLLTTTGTPYTEKHGAETTTIYTSNIPFGSVFVMFVKQGVRVKPTGRWKRPTDACYLSVPMPHRAMQSDELRQVRRIRGAAVARIATRCLLQVGLSEKSTRNLRVNKALFLL